MRRLNDLLQRVKNTSHAAGAINAGASARRILIVDDDADITSAFSIGLVPPISDFEANSVNNLGNMLGSMP